MYILEIGSVPNELWETTFYDNTFVWLQNMTWVSAKIFDGSWDWETHDLSNASGNFFSNSLEVFAA